MGVRGVWTVTVPGSPALRGYAASLECSFAGRPTALAFGPPGDLRTMLPYIPRYLLHDKLQILFPGCFQHIFQYVPAQASLVRWLRDPRADWKRQTFDFRRQVARFYLILVHENKDNTGPDCAHIQSQCRHNSSLHGSLHSCSHITYRRQPAVGERPC